MKKIKLIVLFLAGSLTVYETSGQANAYINVLTQNSGLVSTGATVYVEVTVGNAGPVDNIPAGKIKTQVSVPASIVSIFATGHVLPSGWTILSNSGASIQICNSSDPIPLFEERTILIKVQGNNIGGPSTIIGQLDIRDNCTNPGSLNGDDPSDNSSTTTIQVVPSCPLTVTASAGTIACNGGTTTLTAAVTNASGAVEYSLNGSPFQAGNTFTVNAAGSPYVVTARVVSTPTCTAITTALTISEPSVVAPPVTATITQPTCTTGTGSIVLSGLPSGNWTINPGAIPGNTSTTSINGLTAGAYAFTVTNAAGCASAASTSVVINVQPATPLVPAIGTIVQPTCTSPAGSVVISNLPAGNWTINPGSIPGNTTVTAIASLASGTYNFTVTNDQGCTSPATPDVVINNVSGAPPAPTVSATQPTCTAATGTITITSDTTGLIFSLDGGTYTAYPPGGYVVTAGSHTLTAQVAGGGCSANVTNITVNAQPPTPAAPTTTVVQPTCTIATGTITITSPTAGLTFSRDGGPYAGYPAGGYTAATGNHTLTAQNAAGCISAIANITVDAQPVSPTASALPGTIACFGGTTSLTVTTTGGTAPFEFSLDGGAFQSDNTFLVGAGTYTVTARDAILCIATTSSVTVTQPAAVVATTSTGAIACNGGAVTLAVSATGGTGTLQYSLNNGPFQAANAFSVGAGTYTVIVKDANNCTVVTSDVTITQPSPLTASATASRITQCGGSTVVKVSASGGITPYVSGVGNYTRGPGTWSFPVTDSGGCTDTTEITIEAPGCVNLRVSPNPARNAIIINHSAAAPGSTMWLFSTVGALLLSKPVPQDAFQTSMDVSRLAAGMYIVVYWNGNEKKAAFFEKISSN